MARREYMTKVVIVMTGAVLLVCSLVIVLGWVAGAFPLIAPLRMLLFDLPLIAAWWLADRGHWRLAGYIPPVLFLLNGIYGTLNVGLQIPMTFYIIAILLTAIFQGGKIKWIMAAVCLVTYLAAGWIYGDRQIDVILPFAITVGGSFVGIVFLQWFEASLLQSALARARVYAIQLQEYRDHLEELVRQRTDALAQAHQALQGTHAQLEVQVQERTASLMGVNRQLEKEIAERRQAEGALRNSTAKIKAMFESIPDGVLFADLQGTIVDVNDAMARLHGYERREELLGRSVFELVAASDRARAKDDLAVTLTVGHSDLIEYKFLIKDGQEFDGEMSSVRLAGSEGNPAGVAALVHDVTERKHVKRELERRNAYLEVLLRINATLRSTLPLKQVLEMIVRGAGEVLGYIGCLIVVPDAAEERLTLAAVWGARFLDAAVKLTSLEAGAFSAPLTVTENPGILAYLSGTMQIWTGESKQIVLGVEPAIDPRLASIASRAMGTEAAVCIPLAAGKKIVGVLIALSPREQPLDEERSMLLGLADQAGLAIETARLYQAAQQEIAARKQAETERKQLLAALEHRNMQLQTAAQISQSASVILVPEELISQAVTLIRDRFNVYYAGLFLVDQASQYAVLHAGTGDAGQQMLARGHRLAIGRESMIGQCVAHARARIALDVGREAARFDNPLLPQTRSEIALPLVSRNKCIGALTIQSAQEAAFSDEDVAALQTMADQLATAIENARLFQQLDAQLGQLRQLNAEITRLQHLLQNITDSMPSVLIALDTEGRILLWNPAAEVLTGFSAASVLGRLLGDCCPNLSRYLELVNQVFRDGQIVRLRGEQISTAAGKTFHEVSIFPLSSDGIQGAVLRIDDVTERMHMEEMMLQSAKMASVGGLAAGMAHEINNPLGAMMQGAQMLQVALDVNRPRTREQLRACGVDPDGFEQYLRMRGVIDYVGGIRETGARAAKIVSDLLGFSRKSASNVAPRDLNYLVEQTLDLAATEYDLKKKYDFRDIKIECLLAPDLPKVSCDGQQIQQVILNLVRNAAQAMAEEKEKRGRGYQPCLIVRTTWQRKSLGQEPSTVEVTASGWVRLEVENNGPNIPEPVRKRLFEPFVTTKEVGEGTGLGLWLCWSIVVERHKGRIWAEPILPAAGASGGERFIVELPTD